MKYKGFKVKHIMNLTDVDDKTIKGSIKEGISLKKFTERYSKAFFEDLEALNIDKADIYPKATEHIKEMVDIVSKLLDKGIAYKADDGSIYFDISKFKEYGKLSHTKIKGLQAGARVKQDQYEKEQAQDFALWKSYSKEDGDVFWDTKIGKGRPGWHIECSAMSTKYLGQPFDIHGGGVDLVFPHHENEIAQSTCSMDKEFVKHWFHNEHLLVNGKKMSKSLGNFFTLRDLLKKGYKAKAIRYLLLSTNYRVQLNFTEDGVKAAENGVERLNDFVLKVKNADGSDNSKVKKLIEDVQKDFEKEMDDDLNISGALAKIFDFVKDVNTLIMDGKVSKSNAKEVIKVMKDFDKVLGVIDFEEEKIDDSIQKLIDEREKARKEKDFSKADKIRDELKEKGIVIEDSKDGVRIKKV